MQAGRFPPADGGQGATSQEEEDEKDKYQHRDPQQFQWEHPFFVLLLPVSGEIFSRGRQQPAALQQHACQHTRGPGNGLWAPTSASSLSLLRRTVRQREEKGDSDSLMNRRMACTSLETALFSFSLSLAALCLWLNCMDVRTSPKPSMQQEQQPSPQYQSINHH